MLVRGVTEGEPMPESTTKHFTKYQWIKWLVWWKFTVVWSSPVWQGCNSHFSNGCYHIETRIKWPTFCFNIGFLDEKCFLVIKQLKLACMDSDCYQSAFVPLTHWGRVTHICVSKLAIIGSDKGLSSGWRQAINWTNAGILLIWPFGTNFSEILIEIYTFSFKKMHLNMSSGKMAAILSQPQCLVAEQATNDNLVHGRMQLYPSSE